METIKERLDKMEDGHWLLIMASQTDHMICGTQKVGVMKDGVVKVMYEDGTVEERKSDEAMISAMDADNPSLLTLVSFVQRRPSYCQ